MTSDRGVGEQMVSDGGKSGPSTQAAPGGQGAASSASTGEGSAGQANAPPVIVVKHVENAERRPVEAYLYAAVPTFTDAPGKK